MTSSRVRSEAAVHPLAHSAISAAYPRREPAVIDEELAWRSLTRASPTRWLFRPSSSIIGRPKRRRILEMQPALSDERLAGAAFLVADADA